MAVLRQFPITPLMAVLRLAAIALALCLSSALTADPVRAAQKLVVIVEDEPITEFDIRQRAALKAALGDSSGSSAQRRKRALQDLIDDVVLEKELTRRKINVTEKMIHDWISNMAKSSSNSVDGLKKTLKSKGVNFKTLERQVAAALRTRWLLDQQNVTVDVEQSEVDREYAKISSDPRLRAVSLYEIVEIALPIEKTSEAMRQQLVYARAVEAQQIAKRYKGCGSLRKAASGIYNVKIGKRIQADGDKLPSDMRKALKQAGTSKLIGPMQTEAGIQMIAYCGTKTIAPQKPPKDAVRNMLLNKKYEEAADKVMRDLRRKAYIEYRDPSYSN